MDNLSFCKQPTDCLLPQCPKDNIPKIEGIVSGVWNKTNQPDNELVALYMMLMLESYKSRGDRGVEFVANNIRHAVLGYVIDAAHELRDRKAETFIIRDLSCKIAANLLARLAPDKKAR